MRRIVLETAAVLVAFLGLTMGAVAWQQPDRLCKKCPEACCPKARECSCISKNHCDCPKPEDIPSCHEAAK